MRTIDELERKLADRASGWASVAETIERAPHATLRPEGSIDLADTLALAIPPDARSRAVRVGEELGRGGMAVVRAGVQEALARRVAVKTLRDDERDEGAAAKLLHEARVTGALEHPNVVPVHDIAWDDRGAPLVVLKHIDGVSWRTLLRDPDRVRREHGATDVLEWHLRVLMQVCNAVHFAHARGVLHRDLKPDNVMIGAFGEVTVLDWGIAIAIGARAGSGGYDPSTLAGTPWYMAPEMLVGPDERGLDATTDVYLLGGLLHEIVTGRAPHQHRELRAIFESVMRSRPELGRDAPPALAAIVERALARAPSDRHPSAQALRIELEGFLAHRASIELASGAIARARDLEEAIDQGAAPRRIDRLFTECRFALQQALAGWPENAPAHEALERLTLRMIEHALATSQPRTAEALLAELPAPPAELAQRVARAAATWEARLERLVILDRDHDPAGGRVPRLALAVLIGTVWTIGPLLFAESGGYGATYASLALIPCTLLVLVSAIVIGLRARFLHTAFNRRVYAAFVIAQGIEIVLYAGGALAGLEPSACQIVMPLVSAAICSMLAATVARGFVPASLAYAATFLVGARWPEHRLLAETVANAMLTITAILIWGSGRVSRT